MLIVNTAEVKISVIGQVDYCFGVHLGEVVQYQPVSVGDGEADSNLYRTGISLITMVRTVSQCNVAVALIVENPLLLIEAGQSSMQAIFSIIRRQLVKLSIKFE